MKPLLYIKNSLLATSMPVCMLSPTLVFLRLDAFYATLVFCTVRYQGLCPLSTVRETISGKL